MLLVVDAGSVVTILNTSTGGGYHYKSSDGGDAVAITPRGVFTVQRQVDGLVDGPLGSLWRPKFFRGGYAVHGAPAVPPYPASHGCVRVSIEAMDWIWSTAAMPLGTPVWIY